MTYSVPRTSAIALGVAALVSLSTLSMTRADTADTSAEPAPTPTVTAPAHPTSTPTPAPTTTAAAPSLNEPAPTPAWAETGPHATAAAQNPAARHYAHRHYAYSHNGHRYYSDNPVGTVAMGVAGGAADLGSVAAYPFYCFPNYGSCAVRVPYRY
jgi:hypothetical protein